MDPEPMEVSETPKLKKGTKKGAGKKSRKGKLIYEPTDTISETPVMNPEWPDQIPFPVAENIDKPLEPEEVTYEAIVFTDPVENTEITGDSPIPDVPNDFDIPPPSDSDVPPADVGPEVEVDICIQDQDYSDYSRKTRTSIPGLDASVPSAGENIPQCAYLTPLVEISIGTTPRHIIYIHQGILSQSAILLSQCSSSTQNSNQIPIQNQNQIQDFDDDDHDDVGVDTGTSTQIKKLALPDTDIEVFTLVMTYLYTNNYKNAATPTTSPQKWDEYTDLESLQKHIQLYSFGRMYEIEGLSKLASQNIEEEDLKTSTQHPPKFHELLQIAKEIYEEGLPKDEIWFTGYVKSAFGRAVVEDPTILQEGWLSETIRDGGRLAVDLFTTLLSSATIMIINTTTDKAPVSTNSSLHLPNLSSDDDNDDDDDEKTKEGTGMTKTKTMTTCPFKNEHLAQLNNKKNGLWKSCEICKRERKRLLKLGSMIMSLAIEEHAPITSDINDDNDDGAAVDVNSSSAKKSNNNKKKKKNKIKKKWRSICQQPHIRLIVSTLSEAGRFDNDEGGGAGNNSRLCPDHEDHLNFVGDRWAWEDCPDCLNDREVMFRKIRDLDLPEQFRDLKLRDSTSSQGYDCVDQDVVGAYDPDALSFIPEAEAENEDEVVSPSIED